MQAAALPRVATPFFLSRELQPAMAQRGWGRIIAVASLQSVRAYAHRIPYGAAKGGVVQLVRTLAQAWSAQGITGQTLFVDGGISAK